MCGWRMIKYLVHFVIGYRVEIDPSKLEAIWDYVGN